MPQKLERNFAMTFRVTENEREMIRRRMAQTGILSQRAFLLRMAIDGQIINVELDSVKEMNRLLGNATNNINQIAKHANESGNIYAADIAEIKVRLDDIWAQQKVILQKVANLLEIGQTKVKKGRRKAGAADEQSEA